MSSVDTDACPVCLEQLPSLPARATLALDEVKAAVLPCKHYTCWPCMKQHRPQRIAGLGDRIWTVDQLLFRITRDKSEELPLASP